jgi:hypothetical protein
MLPDRVPLNGKIWQVISHIWKCTLTTGICSIAIPLETYRIFIMATHQVNWMSEWQLEWDIGSYWHYTLEDRFTVRYEVVGSRKQSVNDVQRPCHVAAVSTGRIDNISYTYPQSYFDIEVMNVTKEELGLVTDNEIERTLTLPPYLSGAYFPSNPDEEGAPSTTRFVGKETVKIDDITYENCDKIILQEAEEQLTGTQKKFEIT